MGLVFFYCSINAVAQNNIQCSILQIPSRPNQDRRFHRRLRLVHGGRGREMEDECGGRVRVSLGCVVALTGGTGEDNKDSVITEP